MLFCCGSIGGNVILQSLSMCPFYMYILSLVFVRIKIDHCVYSKEEGGCFIYVALYVDDMLLIRSNMNTIKEVKKHVSSKFYMKDLGATNFILGMEIKRDWSTRNLWLNQTKYLKQFWNVSTCRIANLWRWKSSWGKG